MFYVALEYLAFVFVVLLLGAGLFFISALVLVSQEAAKRVAETSRKLADRTVQLAHAAVKSSAALNPSDPDR
jgi:uncharacterized iron-regulated membrane protein